MEATLTDVHRNAKRVIRRAEGGQTVSITDHGHLIAVIQPAAARRVVSLADFRAASMTDAAIVAAVQCSHAAP